MATLNRVTLIGRITHDLEAPRQAGQSQVLSFRMAVGRSKKNPATGQWETDPNVLYIDCDAWIKDGKGAGAVLQQYAGKGKEILVEGRLQFDQWDDKNNPGQKRSKHKVIVENVQLLGGKGEGEGQERPAGGQQGQRPQFLPPDEGGDGDIPF